MDKCKHCGGFFNQLHEQLCDWCYMETNRFTVDQKNYKTPTYEELQKENNRLLELCMYALLPKNIYNHELAGDTRKTFMNIIKSNLDKDTCSIRYEIVKAWNRK